MLLPLIAVVKKRKSRGVHLLLLHPFASYGDTPSCKVHFTLQQLSLIEALLNRSAEGLYCSTEKSPPALFALSFSLCTHPETPCDGIPFFSFFLIFENLVVLVRHPRVNSTMIFFFLKNCWSSVVASVVLPQFGAISTFTFFFGETLTETILRKPVQHCFFFKKKTTSEKRAEGKQKPFLSIKIKTTMSICDRAGCHDFRNPECLPYHQFHLKKKMNE